MSFDIQWDTICNDERLALSLKEFLNSKLSSLELPHYLANLQVVDFKFGETAPDITIRDIDIPFHEFYVSANSVSENNTDDNVDDEGDEDEDESEENTDESDTGNVTDRYKLDRMNKNNLDNGKSKYKSNLTSKTKFKSKPKAQFMPDSKNSRPPSPLPFINSHNSLLMPRTSSGLTPTMGHLGVGLGGFGMAGGNNQSNGIHQNYNSSSNGSGSMESENEYFQPLSSSSYKEIKYEDGKMFQNLLKGMNNVNLYSDVEINNNDIMNNNESYNSSDKVDFEKMDTNLDIQLSMDIDWDSKLYIEVICDLLVNYPAPEFIRLPVRLKITDLKIHSLLVVAYIAKKIFISFLCDIYHEFEDDESDNNIVNNNFETRQDSRRSTNTNININKNTKGKERIDILQDMKIEGEIGNLSEGSELWKDSILKTFENAHQLNENVNAGVSNLFQYKIPHETNSGANILSGFSNSDEIGEGNGLVLRNIGKIEKFLMSAFRGLIIDELAWPSWIELDFNETQEEDGEEGEEGEEEEEDNEEEEEDNVDEEEEEDNDKEGGNGGNDADVEGNGVENFENDNDNNNKININETSNNSNKVITGRDRPIVDKDYEDQIGGIDGGLIKGRTHNRKSRRESRGNNEKDDRGFRNYRSVSGMSSIPSTSAIDDSSLYSSDNYSYFTSDSE